MAFHGVLLKEMKKKSDGDCKARSGWTYMKADLALHYPPKMHGREMDRRTSLFCSLTFNAFCCNKVGSWAFVAFWISFLLFVATFLTLLALLTLTYRIREQVVAGSISGSARPIFFPRTDDSRCDMIPFSLIAVHYFDIGNDGKLPVARKEYFEEYWLKELQERREGELVAAM